MAESVNSSLFQGSHYMKLRTASPGQALNWCMAAGGYQHVSECKNLKDPYIVILARKQLYLGSRAGTAFYV